MAIASLTKVTKPMASWDLSPATYNLQDSKDSAGKRGNDNLFWMPPKPQLTTD